jgi:phosphoserine phosphatase
MGLATLIAAGRLDDRIIDRALGLLRELDPKARFLAWIDEGDAADLGYSGDARAARWALDALDGVDLVVQPAEPRWKRLFVADMDSTIIGQECIDELADYVGKKDYVAAITERAMRGEIAFAPALRERVALLKGLPRAIISEVIQKRITLTPGGRTLLATMRAHGAHTCLVSGGFTAFTETIAAMIGFHESRGNILRVGADGRLSGEVEEPILGADAKRAALHELRLRLGLKPEETLVAGDGANDLAMISEAGLGVAYHAKPKVAAAAAARVDHGDLTALLYAQGYHRDEFAGV